MKTPVRIIKILVGVLFIISGLVKANDPLGLGYKMQEFFELWSSSLNEGHFFAKHPLLSFFDFLHAHTLSLAITMITLEVATGTALLIGWMKKFILYLLLLLIVFFAFLTGYAYLSGKFTNCGCFGDCLPITPLTSFLKDVALLLLIVFLLASQKYIQPVFSKKLRTVLFLGSLLFTVLIQWYSLNYLPVVDCLPFKKGNNIEEQTTAKPNQLPAIIGFSLSGMTTGIDSTQIILHQPKAVLIFMRHFENESLWLNEFKKIIADAQQKNIPVYAATSDPETVSEGFEKQKIAIPVFPVDFTLIRSAARTDPALYILKNGTVYNKYSYKKFDAADKEIKKL